MASLPLTFGACYNSYAEQGREGISVSVHVHYGLEFVLTCLPPVLSEVEGLGKALGAS